MQTIKQLFQISIRKREPQDLHYNLQAAVAVVISVILLRYMAMQQISTLSNPLAYSLVSIGTQVAIIYGVLASRNKASRFIQTITALFGVTLIATGAAVIMVLSVVLQLALPILFIWTIYIMVLILRSSLECSFIASLLLTIIYVAASHLVLTLVFPNFEAELMKGLEAMQATLEAAQLKAQSK